MIDPRKRYQKGMVLNDLFPQIDGECACGCGLSIIGRKKKWSSDLCRDSSFRKFAVVKGDLKVIREELFKVDKGACRCCGSITIDWEADHIKPVSKGGGGCDLSNYQTLCKECHKEKTYAVGHRNIISSQAAPINFILAFSAFGQETSFLANVSIEKHKLGSISKSLNWSVCR